MDNVSAIPEYLKKYITQNQKSAEAESMASASMSVPRVSLRAKKFRWQESGEEIFAESESFAVILAVEPGSGKFVKTYYDGPYNPGDTSPPTCSSSDGVVPDTWVTTPQSPVCATCKWNVFGSATSRTGKKTKACRDSKRLWVVRPDDVAGTVYGLNVPVTSLKSLSDLGKKMKEFGAPISAAVIKMSMDEDESYPIVNFDVARWLNDEWGPKAIERNSLRNWSGALPLDHVPQLPNAAQRPSTPQVTDQVQGSGRPGSSSSPADGQTIEGVATLAKGNNVDDALSTWDN
jgi:hypothetical protein